MQDKITDVGTEFHKGVTITVSSRPVRGETQYMAHWTDRDLPHNLPAWVSDYGKAMTEARRLIDSAPDEEAGAAMIGERFDGQE